MTDKHHNQNVSPQRPVVPTDEEIIEANVAWVLTSPHKLYDHQRGKLDAIAVIEVAISERLETIKQHKAISGRRISGSSRDLVAKLRHEVVLMEKAIRRLRSLGLTIASPLADQLRRERENPLPTARELLAPAAKMYGAGKFGRQVKALLDAEKLLPGVDAGKIRPVLIKIAVVTKLANWPLNLCLTAGWGHAGQNGVTMPGKGKLETRAFTVDEAAAWEGADGSALANDATCRRTRLGAVTHDVFLNESACWRNVPSAVWDYTIGGYQVIKKWLSYREYELLGRPLTPDEAREVTHTARRIAALILLQPELDRNYQAVKSATVAL